MNPETICGKLADIGEEVCQLRMSVGKTPDGLAARLATLQDTISTIQQDIARQIDEGLAPTV